MKNIQLSETKNITEKPITVKTGFQFYNKQDQQFHLSVPPLRKTT